MSYKNAMETQMKEVLKNLENPSDTSLRLRGERGECLGIFKIFSQH